MNEQTPYVSRKELRRREAAAAANAAALGVATPSEFAQTAPQMSPSPAVEPAFPVASQAVSVPMPTTPLTASSITPAEAAGASVVGMAGSSARLAAARSTDPDTAVRASNTTRARMARAVDQLMRRVDQFKHSFKTRGKKTIYLS